MKQTAITYGIIAGLVVSAFMATTMLIFARNENFHAGALSMIVGYLGMLIAFTFIFVAIKSYRDKQNNGIISFGKALGIGLLISLIASTLYVITWAFVYKYFVPDYMDKYCAMMAQQARTSYSGVELQDKLHDIQKAKDMYATSLGFTLYTYAEILPVGILVSLVAALVMKRKRPRVVLA